ncbi:MAG: transcription elongation factor subunit Spt4 [Candidatus Hodarchaeales archaeon]
MKKRACKNCNVIVTGEQCPVCKSNANLSPNFSGLIIVLDSNQSEICEKIKKTEPRSYAIRVR